MAEVATFLREQGASSVAMMNRIIGCPHEEGIDYPDGEACPQNRGQHGAIRRRLDAPVAFAITTLSGTRSIVVCACHSVTSPNPEIAGDRRTSARYGVSREARLARGLATAATYHTDTPLIRCTFP